MRKPEKQNGGASVGEVLGVELSPAVPDYVRYEAEKASWQVQHPQATPAEYDQAVREIARVCGV
jgi:hypothetical protein